jgi:hypothetical protein
MAKIGILVGFICLVVVGSNRGIDSCFIKKEETDYERIIRIAAKEIGVVEGAVENSGPRIAQYLAYCNIKSPAPWCAAWVSFIFKEAGYQQPRTAWSPALFPKSKLVKEPKSGCVFGLYYPSIKRIGHCGLVESIRNDLIYGLEGNTNLASSREGDGVYRKIRHRRTIYRYADWIV